MFLAAGIVLFAAFILWEALIVPYLLGNLEVRDHQYSSGVQGLWIMPDGSAEGPYFVDVLQAEEIVGETPGVILINSTYSEVDPLSGELSWGHSEIIAMDKATRMHVGGGDEERDGYAMFPLHVEKKDYEIWYRHLLGKGTWRFVREGARDGLPVYFFNYTVRGADADAEYPEWAPAHVKVDDYGEMEVEPVSGKVVDWEETWEGYVVEDGERRLIDRWTGNFPESTIRRRVLAAAVQKEYIVMAEAAVPAMLLSLALASAVLHCMAREEEAV
jgi:hypothetical protein